MEQAGYPGGIDRETGRTLAINYEAVATGPDDRARLNWFRKQFAKLGIELVIRSTDYNRFQDKLRNGTGQVFMFGWNADYPDPENFLFLLYGPNGKVEHQGENAANYANPEFDRLFDAMKFMEDGPERQAILDRMIEIARTDAPWLWGFFPKAFSLHHRWLYNAHPNQMANNTLKYRRIDPELRQQLRRDWNRPIVWPLWAIAGLILAAGAARLVAGAAPRTEYRAVTAYILRRLLYAVPILIGVNLLTFAALLRGQFTGRHGAHASGRKARHPGGGPGLEAGAWLRQTAALQPGARGPGASDRDHLFSRNRSSCSSSSSARRTMAATSATTSPSACGRVWPLRSRCC